MTRKQTIDLINICLLIFGLGFMFLSKAQEAMFLGIGFFVAAVLNLLFNNHN